MSTIEYTGINKLKSYRNVFYNLGYYLIIGLLLFSGVSKVIDPQPMLETIKAVVNTGEELQIAAATLLPVLELTLGVMLLLKIRVKETLLAVTFLFLFFFLFSVYGAVVGLENDCGCFGNAIKSEFNSWMIIRNLFSLSVVLTILIKELKALAPGKTNK